MVTDCDSFGDFVRIMADAEFAAAFDDLTTKAGDYDADAAVAIYDLVAAFCEINCSRRTTGPRPLVASVFYREAQGGACSFRVEADRFTVLMHWVAVEFRGRQKRACAAG
jgi:hypothetical protein